MRLTTIATAVLLTASPALATGTDPVVVYPFATGENYCPAGLQPVSINGSTCCGKPTTDVTYQQATAANGSARGSYQSSEDRCPIGVKGC